MTLVNIEWHKKCTADISVQHAWLMNAFNDNKQRHLQVCMCTFKENAENP
eukprot:m.318867 g.318867  ORF g.318867 m.318867 type:complete len:50 (-) comp15990_c0_seq38:1131-1280(-)